MSQRNADVLSMAWRQVRAVWAAAPVRCVPPCAGCARGGGVRVRGERGGRRCDLNLQNPNILILHARELKGQRQLRTRACCC